MRFDLYELRPEVKPICQSVSLSDLLDALERMREQALAWVCHEGCPAKPDSIDGDDGYDVLFQGVERTKAAFTRLPFYALQDWFLFTPRSEQGISWRINPRHCRIRIRALRRLQGFDRGYQSMLARLMDYGFRLLRAGGRIAFRSGWVSCPEVDLNGKIPIEDEIYFIKKFYGKLYALYGLWHYHENHRVSWRDGWRHFREYFRRSPSSRLQESLSGSLDLSSGSFTPLPYDVVIPTLNRPETLKKAVDSILKQNPPPQKIIIVDQSDAPIRKKIRSMMEREPRIQLIELSVRGQSTARNAGIEASDAEWVLLFDDDGEAWTGMMQAHQRCVQAYRVPVSTGLSLAPWKTKEDIPKNLRFPQAANVLDTGNCFVRRECILEVGGFDRNFDCGSGADNDLGFRLYRRGYEIILNPYAIRTHAKEPRGGLREHGAWWREKVEGSNVFPARTQLYTLKKYFPRRYWNPLILSYYFKAKRRLSYFELVRLWIRFPRYYPRATRLIHDLETPPSHEGWIPEEDAK